MIDDHELDRAVAHYREHGWARLGQLCDEPTIEALRTRCDEIMLGKVAYDGLFFQHDAATGNYDDLAYGKGWEGPSLAYRKIEKLEKDPLYWAWLSNDVFRRVAARVYPEKDVTLYRAFLMIKNAAGGTPLPWHQDGGEFWGLDRDPVLQIWTGLDDAPEDGGCVEVVDGSHMGGLATPLGGVVPPNKLAERHADARALPLPTRAGEVLLLHNHVWHRSGTSRTGHARRGLSVCYMDAATQCRRKKRAPRQFVRVWSAST
jgi:phytanoyl-CoA hydroxylase